MRTTQALCIAASLAYQCSDCSSNQLHIVSAHHAQCMDVVQLHATLLHRGVHHRKQKRTESYKACILIVSITFIIQSHRLSLSHTLIHTTLTHHHTLSRATTTTCSNHHRLVTITLHNHLHYSHPHDASHSRPPVHARISAGSYKTHTATH
jgi:hypothetical protein